ncbi:MAG: hypothetical protein ACN4GT_00185 [Gammaproteobacteria bacterium]
MTDQTTQQIRPSGRRAAVVLLVATLALTGCSQEVVVQTTFPDPLVEEIELDAGVYFAEELKNYDYTEDLPGDVSWSFTLGEANVKMFNRALGALFQELVPVDQPGGVGAPFDRVDLVVAPKLEAFEFSLPRQSRSDQYAVWIKYTIAIHEPDGTLFTEWPVSAYGQADSRLFRGSGAMEAAVVRAMRDAIANIVIGLPEEPNVKAALSPDDVQPEGTATEELAAEPLPGDAVESEDEPAEELPGDTEGTEEIPAEEART